VEHSQAQVSVFQVAAPLQTCGSVGHSHAQEVVFHLWAAGHLIPAKAAVAGQSHPQVPALTTLRGLKQIFCAGSQTHWQLAAS